MKKLFGSSFFGLFLALLLGGFAQASPIGHKFCERPMAPAELKAGLEKSLAGDKTGNMRVEGCKATPRDFLDAWKDEAPGLKTVADLPGLIARFVEVKVSPDLTIASACVRDDYNGVIVRCTYRTLLPGEKAYGIDGHAFLLGNCVNPINADVVKEVVIQANDCLTILFPTRNDQPGTQGRPVRIAQMGVRPVQDRCLMLEVAGAAEAFRGVPQLCPDSYIRLIEGRKVKISCDWTDVETKARTVLQNGKVRIQNVSGSFYSLATGMNRLTIHRSAFRDGMVWICWELPNGKFRTLGVLEEHFVNGVATIPYEMIYGPPSR